MPTKASTTKPTPSNVRPIKRAATVTPEPTKGATNAMTFTATPVDRSTMPQPGKRGGRQSNAPAINAFLASITEPGTTYQMGSPDEDGGHPVNRVTQVRKLAVEDGRNLKVETSPIESGKRYFVFVTLNA